MPTHLWECTSTLQNYIRFDGADNNTILYTQDHIHVTQNSPHASCHATLDKCRTLDSSNYHVDFSAHVRTRNARAPITFQRPCFKDQALKQ